MQFRIQMSILTSGEQKDSLYQLVTAVKLILRPSAYLRSISISILWTGTLDTGQGHRLENVEGLRVLVLVSLLPTLTE